MSVDYNISPVDEKPKSKQVRSGFRKYEPIIMGFLESGHDLVRVDGTDKEANYLAIQLRRVCALKGYDAVKPSAVNGEVYLEKIL